ncbi:hypothetical protein N476_23935 [Pseudoalteromonas luteoviolacea H33]|uniref:Uncharacterized protein n=1 Tax=Pseudoalteromonas luteoviolacea H33 TaxID=1365251 RepID=A0A167C087_9GAMM|nr:hypothetical protein N476_23935 [Pseudoalteromonas luteoviolacea H33]KZN77545.1 hypothetical protein N477_12275 [Pseudoalteromonas luteoviolacea H33-S]
MIFGLWTTNNIIEKERKKLGLRSLVDNYKTKENQMGQAQILLALKIFLVGNALGYLLKEDFLNTCA